MAQRALDPGTDSETISIRVPKAVKASYKRRAKSSGRSLSEWVRVKLDDDTAVVKRGSATATPATTRAGGHEHAEQTTVLNHGTPVPMCKCGSIYVNGRWL